MTVDINGGVLIAAATFTVTVGSLLVLFGVNVLGKISTLSTAVIDIKATMSSMKVDQVASELRLDNKFEKWDARMVQAEINLGVLKAISGIKATTLNGEKAKD